MLEDYTIAQIKSLLDGAESILILCGKPTDIECLTAASAWHLTLKEEGKDSRLVAPAEPEKTDDTLSIKGLDQISTDMGNQNLTISFDYSEEQVDKVSYHISDDNQKFLLTIKPKSGSQPLESSSVEFGYAGASADLLVIIGVDHPDQLEQLYHGYEDLYSNTSSIVLSENPQFGSLKLAVGEGETLGTITATIFNNVSYQLSQDAATNLLYTIDQRTQGLTQETSPETFESIAGLLRAGGERTWKSQNESSASGGKDDKKNSAKKSGSKSDGKNQREITVERKKSQNSKK